MYRPFLLFLLVFFLAHTAAASPVTVGAAVARSAGFPSLQGKRVGVVTNHTALVGGKHLVDLLQESGVSVTALFGPEHGIRGTAEDGRAVKDGIDLRSGAPVFSLYGETRKPTPEMLQQVDLLLFDIQDIGSRFYTYISTMGLAMQAAAEAGIPFVVLDRPNPLGGTYVAGFVVTPAHRSFVGLYPIPVAHGLTVAELALMIKGEAMLPGLEKLDLRVVPMFGWKRDMRWHRTGLPWIATSPNIPDFESALLYPGLCFFEATSMSEGRGTAEPFRLVGGIDIDAAALAAKLNAAALPGVSFEAAEFTPRSLPGSSSAPKFRDTAIQGVRIRVTDPEKVLPVETGIHLLSAVGGEGKLEGFLRIPGFTRLSGTGRLGEMLGNRPAAELIDSWKEDVESFREKRKRYVLYPW